MLWEASKVTEAPEDLSCAGHHSVTLGSHKQVRTRVNFTASEGLSRQCCRGGKGRRLPRSCRICQNTRLGLDLASLGTGRMAESGSALCWWLLLRGDVVLQ